MDGKKSLVPAREVEVSPGDERKLPMVSEYELIVPEGKVAKSLIYGSQLGKNTIDRELERLGKPESVSIYMGVLYWR